MRIPIFDHHCHPDLRSASDYELMALGGVETILAPCSSTGERRHDGRAYAERFDRLLQERERATCFGIELLVALAVNAAEMDEHEAALAGLAEVEARLDRAEVVAIGELALRTFSAAEIDLFVRQLHLAEASGLPVLIEAPVPPADFARLLAILAPELDEGRCDRSRVAIVDLDAGKLRAAVPLRLGGYGIAVSPLCDGPFTIRRKLNENEVLAVVRELGEERLMLNSGLHYGNADPLCLPKCLLRMKLAGAPEKLLTALAYDNAWQFFLPA
jgi:predicted metal-dependent TIM-barrel fold hydrolase